MNPGPIQGKKVKIHLVMAIAAQPSCRDGWTRAALKMVAYFVNHLLQPLRVGMIILVFL